MPRRRRPGDIAISSEFLEPGRLGTAEDAARAQEQDEEQYGDRHDLLVRGGQDPDAEGLEDPEDHPGADRGGAVAETAEDGDGEALDGQGRAAVVSDVRDRADDAPAEGADGGAEHEREGDHIARVDPAETGRVPVRRAGAHLPPREGVAEEPDQRRDGDGADPDGPEDLGRDVNSPEIEGGLRGAREIRERADALAPDVQCRLADQERDPDGDDDHPQDRGLVKPADEDDLDDRPDEERHGDRAQDGQGQGDVLAERHRRHAAQHDEFALGEIDDPRRVVDDIEPDRDDRVDRPVGDPGHQILKKEVQVLLLPSSDREYPRRAGTPDRHIRVSGYFWPRMANFPFLTTSISKASTFSPLWSD